MSYDGIFVNTQTSEGPTVKDLSHPGTTLTNPPTAPSHQKSTHTKNKPQSHIQALSSSHTLSPTMPTEPHLNEPALAQAQTGEHDTATTI